MFNLYVNVGPFGEIEHNHKLLWDIEIGKLPGVVLCPAFYGPNYAKMFRESTIINYNHQSIIDEYILKAKCVNLLCNMNSYLKNIDKADSVILSIICTFPEYGYDAFIDNILNLQNEGFKLISRTARKCQVPVRVSGTTFKGIADATIFTESYERCKERKQ